MLVSAGHVEATLFRTIANPQATQEDVACAYRLALQTPGRFPWPEINRAIITRWSKTGLENVKAKAWRP